jgi:protein-disulfide isomerase
MSNKLDRLASGLLTVAAVAVAVVVVRRELLGAPRLGRTSEINRTDATYFGEWDSFLQHGILVGDSAAPIKIVEFVDFECPACRRFHETVLRATTEEFGAKVSVVFLHFPLSNHRFASIAAQAAECSQSQDRFSDFVNAVFKYQDSLGLKSWGAIALEAGIRDSVGFGACVLAFRRPRIDSGAALARRLGLKGTPSIFVNGWRFDNPPSVEELRQTIRALLAGKKPFS